ncbi:MAG TPA: Gfo/Idh/MocA family oxidoreductase, partial [Blastocatellia bacterium]|nr:Gfo/Idh/MocA family oxidoreductase [Blastocatellia bacterium]
MTNDKINRRDFVKTAIGAAAAAGALSQMHSVKARILGANDRINVAVIGVGGRGRGLLEWAINTGRQEKTPAQVVAVSDVYAKRLRLAREFAKCDGYLDYREIIERKDVDALIIATPDHWHERMAVAALEKGKDVYLEKPMTRTVEEAKK